MGMKARIITFMMQRSEGHEFDILTPAMRLLNDHAEGVGIGLQCVGIHADVCCRTVQDVFQCGHITSE